MSTCAGVSTIVTLSRCSVRSKEPAEWKRPSLPTPSSGAHDGGAADTECRGRIEQPRLRGVVAVPPTFFSEECHLKASHDVQLPNVGLISAKLAMPASVMAKLPSMCASAPTVAQPSRPSVR